MDWLKDRAHLVMLGVGLLNIAVLPFWRLPLAKETTQTVLYPLFGLGLAVFLLSLLVLKRGIGGELEPVRVGYKRHLRPLATPHVRKLCHHHADARWLVGKRLRHSGDSLRLPAQHGLAGTSGRASPSPALRRDVEGLCGKCAFPAALGL